MNIEEFKGKLKNLVKEINAISQKDIVYFHPQRKNKENMAIKGLEGTHIHRTSLYFIPNKSISFIDICPYGIKLEKEMEDFLVGLCGKSFDGYKHPHIQREPYWRVGIEDFDIIRKAAYEYAGLEYQKVSSEYSSYYSNVADDIKVVLEQPDVTTTDKESLIQSRIGQGQFRENLIKLWQSCSVTGFRITSLLVASHIKPWSLSDNKERLDPFNGLLLIPNLDKAFDMGYISFNERGNILISSIFDNIDTLGITSDMQINVKDKNKPYLEFHRTHIFKS